MEFWQSTSDETTARTPPHFWLQQRPPPPQPLFSSYRDFSLQRTTQGRIDPGFGIGCNVESFGQGMGEANGNVDVSYDVNPDILRALEEEKIREDIIAAEMARIREREAAEMARIRELEAEVMEELRMVREMAFRMKGGNIAFDRFRVPMESRGRYLMPEAEEKLAMSLEQRLRIRGRTQTNGMVMLPFQRTNKERTFFLAKRNGYKRRSRRAGSKAEKSAASYTTGLGVQQELKVDPRANPSGRKRKFESAGKGNIPEHSGVGKKRRKKAWRCDLCQVCVTSKVSLNDHLGGKKHKAMEEAVPRAGKKRVRKFSSVQSRKLEKWKGKRSSALTART